jgi:Domain of Unknown Function (DUF1080)
VSLFTGLDLTGWKADGDSWRATDGHLKAVGKADLVSEKPVHRFELMFDCKMPAKSKADWGVEFGTSRTHQVANTDIDHRGKWNRVVVTVGKDEVATTLNGRPMGTSSGPPDAGPIRFKPADGLELMNLFVREVK